MSKKTRIPFRAYDYAEYLEKAGKHAADGPILYQWTGTHWQHIPHDQAERMAFSWLRMRDEDWASPENARRAVRAALLHLPQLPPAGLTSVIPTRNGYVHLRDTGGVDFGPPDPKLGLRYCLACDYLPDASAPALFMAFLERILPDPLVRARVQEYIGYTLLPDARYQRAQIWLGEGANGKGVLSNIVQALHGRPAAASLDNLSGFALSGLVDASLICVDEIPRKAIDEQRLKSMIAGERIQIDRKFLDPLHVPLRGKWLVLGNHLPAVTDHSPGFWRRWDVVPFSVTIPEAERNPLLAQTIIDNELSGVLNWALEGLRRLQARGCFDTQLPPLMEKALADAKVETNSVAAWVRDRGIRADNRHQTRKDKVFQAYREWCSANAMREVSSVQFWKRLKELLPHLHDYRARESRERVRFCNVCLDSVDESDSTGELLGEA
jgi:putative DNA primase/helicase